MFCILNPRGTLTRNIFVYRTHTTTEIKVWGGGENIAACAHGEHQNVLILHILHSNFASINFPINYFFLAERRAKHTKSLWCFRLLTRRKQPGFRPSFGRVPFTLGLQDTIETLKNKCYTCAIWSVTLPSVAQINGNFGKQPGGSGERKLMT